MNLSLVVLAIFAIAVMTVGLIEWVKGWWKKIPQWFPSVASPVFCLVLGQVVAPLVLDANHITILWGVILSLMGLAVTEFCYQIIIQSIPQVVQGLIQSIAPAPPAPQPVAPKPPTP
jgi:hypothetical protein